MFRWKTPGARLKLNTVLKHTTTASNDQIIRSNTDECYYNTVLQNKRSINIHATVRGSGPEYDYKLLHWAVYKHKYDRLDWISETLGG